VARHRNFAIALLALGLIVAGFAIVVVGETGSNREQSRSVTLALRHDVKDLTPREKRAFVNAILTAKHTPDPQDPSKSRYDAFVAVHREAFRCNHGWQHDGGWAGAAHYSSTFLPWHREYLLKFEQMLRDVSGDHSLVLPYWDWTDPASTAAAFASDMMGGNGDPAHNWAVTDGPFRRGAWMLTIQDPAAVLIGVAKPKPYLVRRFGSYFGAVLALPSARAVWATIGVKHYDHSPYDAMAGTGDSFRNDLEGWREPVPPVCSAGWIRQFQRPDVPPAFHNLVHAYIAGYWRAGGSMVQGTMAYNTSPNDPIFFLMHANIDRVFAAWEERQRGTYLPASGAAVGWNGSDTMWPWRDRTINSLLDTSRNGYRYEALPIRGN